MKPNFVAAGLIGAIVGLVAFFAVFYFAPPVGSITTYVTSGLIVGIILEKLFPGFFPSMGFKL